MIEGCKQHPVCFAVCGVVAVALTLATPGQARSNKPRPPARPPLPPAVILQEREYLQVAFVLLAAANGNYDGHRVKAMKLVDDVIQGLGARIDRTAPAPAILKKHTDDALASYYKHLRKAMPKKHEPQIVSNAQVFLARQMLLNLDAALAASKRQPRVRGHLESAIKHLSAALSIR